MAKVLSLSLRDALYADLSELAELNTCSVLDIIREAIDLYLQALEDLDTMGLYLDDSLIRTPWDSN